MNNKELTELKGKMREFGELIDRWASLYGIELSDKAKTALSYEMATNYISNDEIKREAVREFVKWYNDVPDYAIDMRIDIDEVSKYLTQKENNE